MTFTYRKLKGKEEEEDPQLAAYLQQNQARYSKQFPIQLFVTTYNVNKRQPLVDLQAWLGRDASTLPHLIAIGLQEVEPVSGMFMANFKPVLGGRLGQGHGGGAISKRPEEWLDHIERNLPNGYRVLTYVNLVGILLVIYHRPFSSVPISDVQTAVVPTGYVGLVANKGGVAISLRVYDTFVCFVNCHLDAGRALNSHHVRNQQYHHITRVKFPSTIPLFEHDVIVWMGDMNYRLSFPEPANLLEVVGKCNSKECWDLLRNDELTIDRHRGHAFPGFREGEIRFRPTYRYVIGEQRWDLQRFPAWCDRILWWTKKADGSDVQQHDYNSAPEAVYSDHKPVCATFALACTQVDWGKRKVLVEEARSKKHHCCKKRDATGTKKTEHQCSSICCLKEG